MMKRNPIMQNFAWGHLPAPLRPVSKAICELAFHMEKSLPANAETSAGLRKLLEAKDCFVRATFQKDVAEDFDGSNPHPQVPYPLASASTSGTKVPE